MPDTASADPPPAPPVVRRVFRMIGTHLARTLPQVPIEPGGNRRSVDGPASVVHPGAGVAPGMDFADRADGAIPNPFHRGANCFPRMALIAQLGSHAGFFGDLRDLARFPDIMGERFFAIDMLARLHAGDGNVSVEVI